MWCRSGVTAPRCLQVAAPKQARSPARAVQCRRLPGRELEQLEPQAQVLVPMLEVAAQRKEPPAVEPGRVARPVEAAVAAELRERAVFS